MDFSFNIMCDEQHPSNDHHFENEQVMTLQWPPCIISLIINSIRGTHK